MTMTLVADYRTGIGWHSQATLAGLTGRSERYVRDMLSELTRRSDGIRITRKRRSAPDGRGRASDEWQVLVPESPVQPAQRAGSSEDSAARGAGRPARTNRHANPVGPPSTGTPRPFNRHEDAVQPAQRAGDPDLIRDLDPDLTTTTTTVVVVEAKPALPRNLEEALALPLLERAQLAFQADQRGDAFRAQAMCPHDWPEVQRLAARFRELTGLAHVQAGPWPNANTKRLVELLAVPQLPSTIEQAFGALEGSSWWEQPEKRRLGLAGISPRVLESLLTERAQGRPSSATRDMVRRIRAAGAAPLEPALVGNMLPTFGGTE